MSLFKKAVPWLLLPLVAAALGACSSAKPKFQEDELFSSTASPYSRNFDFPATDACEAARRGLLSQGYMTTMTHTDAVDATKNFQPASDTHVVVEVHVVCTAGDASNTSVVYVNAVQNGYALKKSDTSASVGLSIFGSLSVPIRTNNDAMVKISSETIQSGSFYDKFFDLVGRYLRTSARSEPVPRGSIEITPLPPPASPSPPIAVVTPAAALASRTVAPVIADASVATASAAASAVSAAVAQAVANHPQLAAPATAARAATVETTASIQPTTTDGTHTMMATLPGPGEPPILAGPSGYEAAGTRASGSAARAGAAHAPAAGASGSVTPALQAQAATTRTSAAQDSAAQTPAAPVSAAQTSAAPPSAAQAPASPTSTAHTAAAPAANSPAATPTPASGAASSTPVTTAAPAANPAAATAQ